MASSHSSDDDESSSTRRHRPRNGSAPRQGYLPNITEHVVSRCGTPPALNIVTNSQLFPAVQPMYAPRWSSQLPESYLPSANTGGREKIKYRDHLTTEDELKYNLVPEVGRWSVETGSDNEFCHKNSPNPLPNPDVTPDTCLPPLQTDQYVVRTHYDTQYMANLQSSKNDYMNKRMPSHDNVNYQDYTERMSDNEEKHHDKYHFPYTGNL